MEVGESQSEACTNKVSSRPSKPKCEALNSICRMEQRKGGKEGRREEGREERKEGGREGGRKKRKERRERGGEGGREEL
jgi:hypothetical protein